MTHSRHVQPLAGHRQHPIVASCVSVALQCLLRACVKRAPRHVKIFASQKHFNGGLGGGGGLGGLAAAIWSSMAFVRARSASVQPMSSSSGWTSAWAPSPALSSPLSSASSGNMYSDDSSTTDGDDDVRSSLSSQSPSWLFDSELYPGPRPSTSSVL